jgi:cell wall-associated NlpC family hydrolase
MRKLLDILLEELIEQGGKFRSAVDLSGNLSPNVAKIGDDGGVTSTYTKKMTQTTDDITLGEYDPIRAKELVNIAKGYIGTPYEFGGCNPSTGLDCSCFIKTVYNDFGYPLSYRTTNNQKDNSETVSDSDLREGDLVFFNTDSNSSDVDHVGLIISEPGSSTIDMIHASSSDGVIEVNNIKGNSYWSGKLISFGRYPIYESGSI